MPYDPDYQVQHSSRTVSICDYIVSLGQQDTLYRLLGAGAFVRLLQRGCLVEREWLLRLLLDAAESWRRRVLRRCYVWLVLVCYASDGECRPCRSSCGIS